jgi:hypothetical protein
MTSRDGYPAEMQRICDEVCRMLGWPPADYGKLAAEAEDAHRDDPWVWYCRACASKGTEPDRDARDDAARTHLAETPCGRHAVTGWSEAGHLLHVWTYPLSAVARYN